MDTTSVTENAAQLNNPMNMSTYIALVALAISIFALIRSFFREIKVTKPDGGANVGITNSGGTELMIQIRKRILLEGNDEKKVEAFFDGLYSTNNFKKYLESFNSEYPNKEEEFAWTLLGREETIYTHLFHSDRIEALFAPVVSLSIRYRYNWLIRFDRTRTYIFRYAVREKIGESHIPANKRDKYFQPYDQWTQICSFRN